MESQDGKGEIRMKLYELINDYQEIIESEEFNEEAKEQILSAITEELQSKEGNLLHISRNFKAEIETYRQRNKTPAGYEKIETKRIRPIQRVCIGLLEKIRYGKGKKYLRNNLLYPQKKCTD